MSADTTQPQRVVVAMSGGVDSSVTAALMHEQGHEVIGVTLRLRPCDDNLSSRSCCGTDGIVQARDVAASLGIPHYVIDCERVFEDTVLKPAWDAYARGQTPNSCLVCNQRIKFGLLLDWAADIGATLVASGHYAVIERQPNGEIALRRGSDRHKDQSYFLARLEPAQLARLAFPLGGYQKAEVRELARRFALATADKKESQDACLVAEGQSLAETLRQRFGGEARAGSVVDTDGHVWGKHAGIHSFTIGQRRGLGFGTNGRAWVKELQPDTGLVVISHKPEELDSLKLTVSDLRWTTPQPPSLPRACDVQVRYRHASQKAMLSLSPTSGGVEVSFAEPVRAAAPGQAAVFYDGDRVLGSGWIDAAH